MPITMRRFSSDRYNLRARPWLVLWLLPYLLLSIAASAHNHGIGSGPTDHHAEHSLTQHVAETVIAPLAAAAHVSHDALCLACQWAGFAAALLTPAFVLFLFVGSLPVALLLLSSSRRCPVRVAVRGPPAR